MLGKLFLKRSIKVARRDVKNFCSMMSPMHGDELAIPLLATLAAAEMAYDERGIDVYRPFEAMVQDPSILPFFTNMALQLQNTERQALAPGAMVWTHTLRGTADHEVRSMAQGMWAKLVTGAPHVEAARTDLVLAFGVYPEIDHADRVPDGFALPG